MTAYSSCYSHAVCRFGNNNPVSLVVSHGFIVGQKQLWKFIYFLFFPRGVKHHLKCNLDYQKYEMLQVRQIVYRQVYIHIYSHICTYNCTNRKSSCLLCCRI